MQKWGLQHWPPSSAELTWPLQDWIFPNFWADNFGDLNETEKSMFSPDHFNCVILLTYSIGLDLVDEGLLEKNVSSSIFKSQLIRCEKKTMTVGGSITVWLIPSFTSLDSTAPLHTNNNIFPFLVKSNLVQLETSCTVILFPTVSVPLCDQ